MKKTLNIILIGILSLGVATGCGCEKKEKENNNNSNTSAVIGDTKVKNLDIIDFIVVNENNVSTIYYTIENNTEESINYSKIDCEMYDKKGNLIYKLTSDLGNLNSKESKDIEKNISIDLSDVATVKYNVE